MRIADTAVDQAEANAGQSAADRGSIVSTVAVALGFAIPVVTAPLVVMCLRPLFSVFVKEGAQLFAGIGLPGVYADSIGSRLAKINVAILLATWIVVFTCECLEVSHLIRGGVTIAGVLGALVATTYLLRWNLGVRGWDSWRMGMLSFAGGNLPIFMIVAAILALR